jgi:hypothetical protein
LSAGRYVVEASAQNFQPRREVVSVTSGRPSALDWRLEAVKVERPAAPVVRVTRDFFDNPAAWKAEDDGWYTTEGKGKGYNWLRKRSGILNLDVRMPKGRFLARGHVDWAVNYVDERNFISYTLTNDNITRKTVVDGKIRDDETYAHRMGKQTTYSLRVDVEPKRILIQDGDGKTIREYVGTGDFTQGRIGFKDDVSLKIRE